MKHVTFDIKKISWFSVAFSQLTVVNTGFFATLSILAVYLVKSLEFSAAEASLCFASASIGLRFSRPFLALLLDKTSAVRAIRLSIIACAAGFAGLAVSSSLLWVCASLLVFGAGYAANGITVTTLASLNDGEKQTVFSRFSLMNFGTSIAAAIGPVISSWLWIDVSDVSPFVFSAVLMMLSFAISLLLPETLPETRSADGWVKTLSQLFRERDYIKSLIIVAMGWFLYTQKFSSISLYVGDDIARPDLLGVIISANAVIVALVSVISMRIAKESHIEIASLVLIAFILYSAAFINIWWFARTEAVFVSLVIWSVAEGILMPALNSLIAERTSRDSRLIAYSVAAIAIGAGEIAGNSFSILAYDFFKNKGVAQDIFLLVAICAFGFAVMLRVLKQSAEALAVEVKNVCAE